MIFASMGVNRRRLFALLAIAILCVVAWLVVQHNRANPVIPLKVALVRREAESMSENVIEAALSKLLKDYNASGRVHLELEVYTASGQQSLAYIYKDMIKPRDDIVAVIDNSWGVELKAAEVGGTIKELRRPVIFLNGDRLEETGEDQPWIFLGTADHIPQQIKVLVDKVRESDPGAPVAFLLEQRLTKARAAPTGNAASTVSATAQPTSTSAPAFARYAAAEQTRQLLNNPDMHLIDLACDDGWRLADRSALMSARSRLIAAFPEYESNEKRKIIVAFTHASWGSEIIRWIDSTFRTTTIVAYQSAVSSDRPIPLREGTGNQLILLGQDATAFSPQLLALHAQLASEHADLAWNQTTDIFFLRRAVVACELVTASLREAEVGSLDLRVPEVQRAIAFGAATRIRDIEGPIRLSRLPKLDFNAEGVERSGGRITLRRGTIVDNYPFQFDESGRLVENFQVRVSQVSINDHDSRSDVMKFRLVLYVNCTRAHSTSHLKGASGLDIQIRESLQFGNRDDEEFAASLLDYRMIGDKIELAYLIQGVLRFPDSKPWLYPFDRHVVETILVAPKIGQDVSIDVMPDPQNRTESDGDAGGWLVNHPRLEREDGVEILLGRNRTDMQDYQTRRSPAVLFRVELLRKPWRGFVLVYLPLLLIALGSTSILFIRLGDANSPVAPGEILKTQCELCLGCLLAVVTYLISYAGLVPRIERPIYCDALLGLTLLLVAFNFIFIVAFAHRESNPLLRFWNVSRYRTASALTMLFIFGLWPAPGFL